MQGKRRKEDETAVKLKPAFSKPGAKSGGVPPLAEELVEPASDGSDSDGSIMDADLEADDGSDDGGEEGNVEFQAEIVEDTRKGEKVLTFCTDAARPFSGIFAATGDITHIWQIHPCPST